MTARATLSFLVRTLVLSSGIVCLAFLVATASCSSSDGEDSVSDTHAGGREDISYGGSDSLTENDTGGNGPPRQGECAVDDQCPEDHWCDCDYMCRPNFDGMCETDMNCGSGSYCHPCERECYEQRGICEPCISENRCDPRTGICEKVGVQCLSPNISTPSHCLDFADGNSYCGWPCENNYGCHIFGPGYECVEISGLDSKQCVPTVRACGSGEDCQVDADCPYGEICNELGTCAMGCVDDEQCQDGQVCSAHRCQEACHDVNNPCDEGLECVEGRCRIPGSCRDKYDCHERETYCDPETNMCLPGCLEDYDCKRSAFMCDDGECVRRPCERHWNCAFGQVCEYELGECKEAEGPYCDPCDPNDENACGEGNECIGLQDEDGNHLGDYCFVQCFPTELDRCPVGYECVPLQDQGGVTQNEVCFRPCHVEPVVRDEDYF